MITPIKSKNKTLIVGDLMPKRTIEADFATLAPHVLSDKQSKDTIKRRVKITVMTILILVIVVGSLGAYGVYISTTQANAINTKYSLVTAANSDLLLQTTTGELAIRSYYLSGDEGFLVNFENARAKMIASSRNLLLRAGEISDPGIDQLVRDYTGLVGVWLATFADKTHVFSGADNPRISQITGVELVEGIRAKSEVVSKFLADANTNSVLAAVRVRTLTIVVLSIVIALSLITAMLLIASQQADISYPLVNLQKVVTSIYQGEFGKRANESIGPVEVRSVAHAVNELANQREQVVDQTERLRQAKSNFIGTVNHELRTPLTSIAGFTELLSDESSEVESGERVRMAKVIGRNAARLSDLIDNMLTVLRIDANQVRFKLATFDARDAVEQAVAALEPIAQAQNIEVEFTVPTDEYLMLTDAVEIVRVVGNLLSNAIKFSIPGGRVIITMEKSVNELGVAMMDLSVKDYGIGIVEGDLKNVGSKFFRSTNAIEAAIPGSGLGLMIVNFIVTELGGAWSIDSSEAEGTTTHVWLPLIETEI
jgi:two-component system OmpR family sensor kinase